MIIGFAADHGGYEMKAVLMEHLSSIGIEVADYGTNSADSVDYPDYALILSRAVLSGEVDYGVAICGTGVGMSIACNKVDGIRAAHCTDSYTARLVREHNDANILCLGARITGIEIAKEIVAAYANAAFAGGRHAKRVEKMMQIQDGGRIDG